MEETKAQETTAPRGRPYYRHSFPQSYGEVWELANPGEKAPQSIAMRESTLQDREIVREMARANPELDFAAELVKLCIVEIDGVKTANSPSAVNEFHRKMPNKHRDLVSSLWAYYNVASPEEVVSFFATREVVFS